MDHDKYMKEKYSWANDDQRECLNFIFDSIGGEHHLVGKIKPCGISGIEYNNFHNLATFDNNMLTNLVFRAHERMIRFSVHPCNMQLLKWRVFKRKTRTGKFCEKHPTILKALEDYNK